MRLPTLMLSNTADAQYTVSNQTKGTTSGVSPVFPGHYESRSQPRRSIAFGNYTYSWQSKQFTTIARPIGLPVTSRSATGSFNVWRSATPVHFCCPKKLVNTKLLNFPWLVSSYVYLSISEVQGKSLFRLQIPFASSRVTSTSLLIFKRPTSNVQPDLIQSSSVQYAYYTSMHFFQGILR